MLFGSSEQEIDGLNAFRLNLYPHELEKLFSKKSKFSNIRFYTPEMLGVNRAGNENEKDFIASCEFALKHRQQSDDVVYIDKNNYEMFITDTYFEIKKEYDKKDNAYYVYQKHLCSNLENLFMTLSAVYNIGYNEALKMPIDMANKYNNNSNFHKVVF